jgi:hypothetical protein
MQDKLPWLYNLHIEGFFLEAFGATGLWTVTGPMGFGSFIAKFLQASPQLQPMAENFMQRSHMTDWNLDRSKI